ncbi:unnamed protein product [Owenia fusiformis]|uniref:VWFD domain-containing protein n=1 Tax=Owenia fusiformis TaxID=6347 RepID=A0A8S4P2G5_OWEFU|nr:unnamed protein product [Owenia fusiformis]
MKHLVILSLFSLTCSVVFGEEDLTRVVRQLPQVLNQCTCFDKLEQLAKKYRTLSIADLSFDVTTVSALMQNYTAHPIMKTYVSVFENYVVANVKALADSLVKFHNARPKMVDALTKVTFNNAVRNKGLDFMNSSLPFYTHGSEKLRFEDISSYALKSVLKSGLQLSKMVKNATRLSNSDERSILSQLSRSILPLTQSGRTGWKAYGQINKGFKKIKKACRSAVRRSARSIRDERGSICGLSCPPPLLPPGCPDCGEHGSCAKLPSGRYFCKCNPMYHGELCYSKYERSEMVECTAWGDVHFTTFDGAKFEIQNQCELRLVNGFGAVPHFEVKLLPYFKSPGAHVSYTKRISVITRDDTKDTLIEIFHKDGAGHRVKIDGVRVSKFPKTLVVIYTIGGQPYAIHHIISIITRDSTDFVEVNMEEDVGVIVQYDGNPANGRTYVRLADYWKLNVDGVCGNYDGNPENDIRTRSDAFYVYRGNEKNHGVLIGNSWKTSHECKSTVMDDSFNIDRPWRDLHGWHKKRRDINKLMLTKLYCQIADCLGEVGHHKWESCVADTYYAESVEHQCHILETNVFAKSKCWREEFNCSAIFEHGLYGK